MKKEAKEQNRQSRRAFLKGAGVAGVAGIAAVASMKGDEAQAHETAPAKAAGYRETDKVRAYYAAARY